MDLRIKTVTMFQSTRSFLICALIFSQNISVVECFSDTSDDKLRGNTTVQPFHVTAKTLLDEMGNGFGGFNEILDRAFKNISKFNDLDDDHKWAAIVINIYTSPDKIQNGTKDSVHHTLNHKLLRSDPLKIWIRYGNVLEEAMKIIGEEKFKLLFRGEEYNYRNKLVHQPSTKRFYSTTLDPNVTKFFGGSDGILYIILNATGTNISKYSDMPGEEEVLIKPGRHFNLVTCADNKEDVQDILSQMKQNYGFEIESSRPKLLVVLKETNASNFENISLVLVNKTDVLRCAQNSPPDTGNKTNSSRGQNSSSALIYLLIFVVVFMGDSCQYRFGFSIQTTHSL
ncbi:Ecto-ADP-ribosyltransferase 4 [Mactra antiquata]